MLELHVDIVDTQGLQLIETVVSIADPVWSMHPKGFYNPTSASVVITCNYCHCQSWEVSRIVQQNVKMQYCLMLTLLSALHWSSTWNQTSHPSIPCLLQTHSKVISKGYGCVRQWGIPSKYFQMAFFRHLFGKLLFHHQIWWYPYFQTIPDRVGTDIFAAKISNYAMVYAPTDSVYT